MNEYDTYGLALLSERKRKIKDIILYGENDINDFCIAWSGGKDSTALSFLIDLAIPDNNIPRVYNDTGIELSMIRNYVCETAKHDNRVVIIKPTTPIKRMLEVDGYPFKSKEHSKYLNVYQNSGKTKTYYRYLEPSEQRKRYGCPKQLRYQFNASFKLKVSNKCCDRLKKEPFKKWQHEHNKPISIVGIRADEGGNRINSTCQVFSNNSLIKFQPLIRATNDWIDWFIEYFNIPICDIYKEPYNFKRTGCKGCPFARDLQQELDTLEKYFPNERKQCEIIWKPVYDEYRRIGYRLKG